MKLVKLSGIADTSSTIGKQGKAFLLYFYSRYYFKYYVRFSRKVPLCRRSYLTRPQSSLLNRAARNAPLGRSSLANINKRLRDDWGRFSGRITKLAKKGYSMYGFLHLKLWLPVSQAVFLWLTLTFTLQLVSAPLYISVSIQKLAKTIHY